MNTTSQSTPCPAGTCKNYRYGHLLHWLHADVAVYATAPGAAPS